MLEDNQQPQITVEVVSPFLLKDRFHPQSSIPLCCKHRNLLISLWPFEFENLLELFFGIRSISLRGPISQIHMFFFLKLFQLFPSILSRVIPLPKRFQAFFLNDKFHMSPSSILFSDGFAQFCLQNTWRQKDEADSILVDLWFGAFEVPVDDIRSFTWDEMHPPLPPLPLDPFFPTWVWGLISSASSAVVMLIPLYCCLLEAD